MTKASPFGPLQAGILLFTVATALIHLQLSFPDPLFILNGLGYLAIVGAMYAPPPSLRPFRPLFRWILIGYTAVTLIAYFLIAQPKMLGLVTKAIEIALILLLWIEDRVESDTWIV